MTEEKLDEEAKDCARSILFWLKMHIDAKNVEEGGYHILKLLKPREEKIKELEEEISNLLSCKDCPDNHGGYICDKEYNDKCLRQKIQYIKELKEEITTLEKKNAELKSQIEKMKCPQNCKNGSVYNWSDNSIRMDCKKVRTLHEDNWQEKCKGCKYWELRR